MVPSGSPTPSHSVNLYKVGFVAFRVLVATPLIGNEFLVGWSCLGILLIGIFLSSGFVPFNETLNQAGYPGSQSVLVSLTVLSNIVLNAILIPRLGINGAALATSCSFLLNAFYLFILVKRKVKLFAVN